MELKKLMQEMVNLEEKVEMKRQADSFKQIESVIKGMSSDQQLIIKKEGNNFHFTLLTDEE